MLQKSAESVKENIFDINDTSPLKLIKFDQQQNRLSTVIITKDSPLYFIIKFLKALIDNTEQEKTLPLETLHQISIYRCQISMKMIKIMRFALCFNPLRIRQRIIY